MYIQSENLLNFSLQWLTVLYKYWFVLLRWSKSQTQTIRCKKLLHLLSQSNLYIFSHYLVFHRFFTLAFYTLSFLSTLYNFFQPFVLILSHAKGRVPFPDVLVVLWVYFYSFQTNSLFFLKVRLRLEVLHAIALARIQFSNFF